MKNKEYKRILIIEVNWLGDVLFSTPLIRAVREHFGGAHITCMVAPRAREILKYNPHIDEIITYDEKGTHKSILGKIRLISALRKKDFDLAILLHRSFTKALMTLLAGARERIGYVTKKRRILLTRPVETPAEELHKVEYFLKIAESLGCDITNKNYEFFITDKEKRCIEKRLAESGVKKEDFVVVINAGGNWMPKRWSEESFSRLADRLISEYNAKVVVSGAEKDIKLAARIQSKMKENLIVFCGKTNLSELGALMKRADVVISGDSGPMHIAVAVRSNVIAIFGPTSPHLTGPYGDGNYRVIQKDTDCEVPCYELGCSNYKCMDAVTVDDVLRVFGRMYEGTKNK